MEDLGNGFTVFYGSKDNTSCDVVEITVKGFFTPLENKKNYQKDASDSASELQRNLSAMMSSHDGTDSHFIVSTDFTERGIHMGSKCKLKYQMYIRPTVLTTIENNRELVMSIVSDANSILGRVLEEHGFEVAG